MYSWRGYSRFWEPSERLSVLELINSGTLGLRLAGLLWLMMENRSSVIVSAGPSFAGKSTTLNVLLDFLPPEVKQIHLSGADEDFRFLKDARPAETYMVAAEFNTYLGYIWGDVARKAFQLLVQGYSLGGTIHARSAKEVVYILYQYLDLPLQTIAQIGAIINLRVIPGRTYAAGPVRQVESVSLPVFAADGMTIKRIAFRSSGSDEIEIADNKSLQEVFSEKFGFGNTDFGHEIEIRGQVLERLLQEGRLAHTEVRQAILEFYESRAP
jgi:hypothetical protein